MTSIASISSVSMLHSPVKAAQSSSLGSSRGSSAASASGDTTAVTMNADGSTTTTVTSASGQIVSSSTTAPVNQAQVASGFAQQADKSELAKLMPASLLNVVA